jgi:transposase
MPQITTRVSSSLVKDIDRAAASLHRTRADLIRRAIEYYLDDLEDIEAGLAVLKDPSDPILDWSSVREELLGAA